MYIYNSLTKKKEEFQPLAGPGGRVNMYSCGVTVYDKCHIGHARSLYIFDVIRRHLKNRGFDVHFVRNITDVDDKIINKANQTGKSFDAVVAENISLYHQDLERLEINLADKEPRATENIEGMVGHIKDLIAKGYAYESEGDVYFRVRAFKDYGKLSGQSVDNMLEAVRIDADEKKQDALDFALWKRSKPGEPAWPSPWSDGRPGWHIECSVMSMKYLQCETLDIHAGGRDLVFPHHENEIAQSEALTGKPFAKYWIHHGLLKINGQKMAKSLNNFITVADVMKRYSPNVLKLFYLQSHYSSEIDFSWEKMEEVKKVYDRLNILVNKLEAIRKRKSDLTYGEEYWKSFLEKMDDNFNTAQALAVLLEYVKVCNTQLENADQNIANLDAGVQILKRMTGAFGLTFPVVVEEIPEDIKDLLETRKQARANKDFKRSDELRDLLKNKGIIVEDGKQGQTFRKI